MRVSGSVPGGGGAFTCSVAVSATPFGAVAMISASPGDSAVARPFALTLAIAGCALDQANVAVMTWRPFASNAAALNCCVLSCRTVALAGVIVTVAIGPTGVEISSLQASKVLRVGPLQLPSPSR